jgi:type IV secretory pathway VirB4 component
MASRQDAVSTQALIDIASIADGVVVLRNGGVRQVVMVGGINFDLKSEEEQNLIIAGYQNFLNTLDFSIQILVHSRKLNVQKYLDMLSGRAENESNETLRNQIGEYQRFISSFVTENAIMTKNFFVVVPYDAPTLPKGVGMFSGIFGGGKKQEGENMSLQQSVQQVRQRTDHVVQALQGVGLNGIPLNDEELAELFYNLYNPAAIERQSTPTEH